MIYSRKSDHVPNKSNPSWTGNDYRPDSSSDSDQSADDEDWIGTQLGRLQLDGEDGLIYFGHSGTLQHASTLSPSTVIESGHSPLSDAVPPVANGVARPWFEWDRHLPPGLISRETHDDLLDLFGSFFAPWCMVVDMNQFKAGMQRCLTNAPGQPSLYRSTHYSPFLHNILLALACTLWKGSQVRPFPYPDPGRYPSTDPPAVTVSNAFYNHAVRQKEGEMTRPIVSTVRATMLLASINASRSQATLGYIYAGTAFRMCSVLGLNIDCGKYVEKEIVSSDVQQSRDMLFHTAFVQERLWALGQGRFPMTLQAGEHNISLPDIDLAADATPWLSPRGYSFTTGACPPSLLAPGWVSTCFHWTVRMAHIQDDIMKLCYGLRPTRPGLAEWTSLCGQLNNWAAELPNLYDAVYGLEYAPLTSTHAAFMAGSVFLLAARYAATHPTAPARPSLFYLTRCLSALAKISTTWADSTRAILEAVKTRWLPFTNASPLPIPPTLVAPVVIPPPAVEQTGLPLGSLGFGAGSPGSVQTDEHWLNIFAGLTQVPDMSPFLRASPTGGDNLFAAFGVNEGVIATEGEGVAMGYDWTGSGLRFAAGVGQGEGYDPTQASLGFDLAGRKSAGSRSGAGGRGGLQEFDFELTY